MPDDEEQIVELPVVLRVPIARLRGISLVPEGEGTGWIAPLADRIPTEEWFAAELAKHVDGILFIDSEPTNRDFPGPSKRDSGGLRCSCGGWEHGPVNGIRPRAAWHRHVASVLVGLIPPQAPSFSAREVIRRIDAVLEPRDYYEAKPHKAYSDLWRVLDILDEWRPPEQAEPSDEG